MTKLYEAKDHLLILAGYGDPAEHRHMAAHIMISTGGTMDIISTDGLIRCQGVMIPSGISHRVQTNGSPVLVFLYDSTTGISAQIQNVQDIPEDVCQRIIHRYRNFEEQDRLDTYGEFMRFVLDCLGLQAPACRINDARIHDALSYIHNHAAEPITCKMVADVVYLSQSRFSHLFREQVGMTVPAYLIYRRLMAVYAQVIQGRSITQSALDAGFSSSGHFADVSRRVFGLSASEITRDLTFLKVE